MIFLDLSWAQLKAKELDSIAVSLALHGKSMRNINLSYNDLDFNCKSPQFPFSNLFM